MKKAKMKGRIKACIAVAMCVFMSLGTVACQTPSQGQTGNTTEILFVVGENAFGTDILQEQAKRFSEKYANKSYAEGKMGVTVKIETSGASINIDEGLLNEGYHIISTGAGYTSVSSAASNGWIASLDDIMTTPLEGESKAIYQKIPEEARWAYYLDSSDPSATIASGYYGIPNEESYGGLTYDKDLFDTKGFYFAGADATDYETFDSEILGNGYSFNFTATDVKSVGVDGKEGTEDDGLPSSLYELIVLCEYMDNSSIKPFIMSGKMGFYINYFTEALYMSLLGYENGRAQKDFKSDAMEVVVGYTEEDLFPGLEGVKKPITVTVTIADQYGYYTTHSLEKYYTFAFMQLMEQEEWYAAASNQPNKGAVDAQKDFIFGLHEPARQAGMLIECSYWYNESRIRGNFLDYDKVYFRTDPDREFRWMTLPGNIFTSVDGSDEVVTTDVNTESKKGEVATLYNPGTGYLCVNARYKDNAEIMGAIKDYFMFKYTDKEMVATSVKGCYRPMLEFEIKDADLANADSYTKSFWNIVNNAKVVQPYGMSEVYKSNSSKLGKQGGSGSYLFGGGNAGITNVRAFLKEKKVNPVLECFEDKIITIAGWNDYFGSSDQVPEAQKYPIGHAKEGQDIAYQFVIKK